MSDTPIARTTGHIWPHAGYTDMYMQRMANIAFCLSPRSTWRPLVFLRTSSGAYVLFHSTLGCWLVVSGRLDTTIGLPHRPPTYHTAICTTPCYGHMYICRGACAGKRGAVSVRRQEHMNSPPVIARHTYTTVNLHTVVVHSSVGILKPDRHGILQ